MWCKSKEWDNPKFIIRDIIENTVQGQILRRLNKCYANIASDLTLPHNRIYRQGNHLSLKKSRIYQKLTKLTRKFSRNRRENFRRTNFRWFSEYDENRCGNKTTNSDKYINFVTEIYILSSCSFRNEDFMVKIIKFWPKNSNSSRKFTVIYHQ